LQDRTFCDLFFVLPDKNPIGAHLCVIQERCPASLTQAVKKRRDKKNGTWLEIAPESGLIEDSIHKVLEYAYTGKINDIKFDTFEPEKCIYLMNAATLYELQELEQIAAKYLQGKIDMKNSYKLLARSDELKVKRAKDICLDYALKNPQFIANKDGVKQLGLDLFQEVVLLQQNPPAKLEPVEVTAPNLIAQDFSQVYQKKSDTGDVVFKVGESNVRCHKAVIAEASKKLSQLVETNQGRGVIMFPPDTPQLSLDAFEAMLKWIYYSCELIKPIESTQLIPFCKFWDLPALNTICENVIREGIAAPTVISILEVAYNKAIEGEGMLQKELRERCLKFITKNLSEINFNPLKNLPAIVAVDVLNKIQETFKNGTPPPTSVPPSRPPTRQPPRGAPPTVGTSGWQRIMPGTSPPSSTSPSPPPSISEPPGFIPPGKQEEVTEVQTKKHTKKRSKKNLKKK